ncbi:hypothetical protein F4825DRAFT_468636 [Nemania diffusa]|nr:hypothetical protein F4825DRAFT_468636 [Nemania diffusa]
MPNPTLMQAHQTGISGHQLAGRGAVSAAILSGGAIAGIATAGSMLFFLLLIGPLLVYLAKRQNRHRAAACPVSSLAFVEDGQLAHDGDINIPRRLRKKSTASEPPVYLGVRYAESEGSEGRASSGRGMSRHLSLPILPPVFSRAKSFGLGSPVPAGPPGSRKGSRRGNWPRSRGCTSEHGEQSHASPAKHRGRAIYQNRRKSSWIDEDALHGPRVSPKKKKLTKTSRWFTGNGLTRTLSRHLSFRGHRAPELARSPTLPYTDTSQGPEVADRVSAKSFEAQGTGSIDSMRRMREFQADTENEPRVPGRQQLYQGGSSSTLVISTGQQGFPIPTAIIPYPESYNDVAIHAAHQLAGRARVPYVDVGANGTRRPGIQQSNTDTELQAILRRTAERLQDGNRSARRQTLMPTSASTSRLPDRAMRCSNQECGCGKDHGPAGDMPPSPAKSQRSAPAELEGCSPGAQQSVSQSAPAWQGHRRTHSRQISHISQVSMLSEPDSRVATPSRRGSQADGMHTALSSPSRMAQTSPSYPQQVMIPRSYTPMSDQSSALSTVYSEEEGTPSILKLDDVPNKGNDMEIIDLDEALQTSDVFDGRQTQRDGEVGNNSETHGFQGNFDSNHSPRSRHTRQGTLGQILPNDTLPSATSALPRPAGVVQPAPRMSPRGRPELRIDTLQNTGEDPFTTRTPPTRGTPQRLSQVFSSLPAVALPNATATPAAANTTKTTVSSSPTPSPTHRRRVLPPPHRLRPSEHHSPTLGSFHSAAARFQTAQTQAAPLPTRGPSSSAASDSGLSSVYESYGYNRYSDSVDGQGSQTRARQQQARLSTSTMITVPSPAAAAKSRCWGNDDDDDEVVIVVDADADADDGASFRSAHERLNNAVSRPPTSAYTHTAGLLPPPPPSSGAMMPGYRQSQGLREASLGGASVFSGGSAYSQDGDGEDGEDRLAPLRPAAMAATRHTMRVTSAVAELRRMNSQVSCVSGYSAATTTHVAGGGDGDGGDGEVTSPTLPALRGGGCSPGKRGVGAGGRNYLSLGACLSGGGGAEEGEMKTGAEDDAAVPRASMRRSRRHTVVESFEQDLDRARRMLRERAGYSVQGIPEGANTSLETGGLMIQVAK